MKITENKYNRQAKKFTRVIPKDIFSLNIPISHRKILVLLYAIRTHKSVSYSNLSMRWNNAGEPVKSGKIRSQLKKHLLDLESLGYIKRCKSKNKFTHIDLNFEAFKSSAVVNIPCELLRDKSIDISSLYISVHYRIKNMFKINYWTKNSQDIGICRQTLSKYVKKSENFESKPLIKQTSKRIIPNFFLKKRLIPKTIYKGKFGTIIRNQNANANAVDKKTQLDDFLTLLLNYTNLNKNIRSGVNKTGDKKVTQNKKHTHKGVETPQKRLSKKRLVHYLDLESESFDRIVYLVKSKLSKQISFSDTSIKLRKWMEYMIFEYENTNYYSFDNDYVFSSFAANAINGKLRVAS